MTKRMLIDAVHPEEVRVALTEDNKLVDFDFETAARRPIKGNIYLAKVTRVEPSLQAAFVEYGGNRQGFLPFSEIHYDYFQIPVEDKKKLESELEKEKKEAEDIDEEDLEKRDIKSQEKETHSVSFSLYRKYSIQEVIKRNQIILIQVIKEERGNKGASITTFISLPGKYCVFMPKTDTQGGVSRKISDFGARKKLRKVVKSLETPKGASVIVRTAGSGCTKAEIRRDFSYLDKLWEKIRDNALASTAPALVYEEGDIIKRSIRDLHNAEIDEVVVEGKEAFKVAKNFMKLLTPKEGEKVIEHKKKDPIFWEYEIEDELAQLYGTEVELKSGGYIVINPTEALVAIDVNSGKATRERSVEETALKTNVEAAKEIARHLKLRDLSGLIVVDFIDMLQLRNKKAVERALKDALRKDRARIQVGRISMFGLLEMSRQRLGSSVVESSTVKCPRCNGLGRISSKHSSAVNLLREIEHDAMLKAKAKDKEINVFTSKELADFMKKERKDEIKKIEEDGGVTISIKADKGLMGAQFAIGKDALKELLADLKEHEEEEDVEVKTAPKIEKSKTAVHQDDVKESEIGTFDEEDEDDDEEEEEERKPRQQRQRRPRQQGAKEGGDQKRNNNRRNNNRNRDDEGDGNRGNSKSGPRPENKKGGGRGKGRNDNNKPRGNRSGNGNNLDDNVGNVGNVTEMPTTKKKTTEASEKEKSVIKSLWKKITD